VGLSHNKMKKKSLLVAAGLGFAQLALLTAGAHAQDRSAASTTISTGLDEVVITASRSSKKQSEIGKVVRVINSEQLQRSQGRTLPELLSNVAGLTLSGSANAPGSEISVFTRGTSSGNTLILIDGVPVNNASTITGEYNISSFSIDQIDRIEILKGGNSTLYGSDAVAGVINIITKQPGLNKLNADLLITAGTYNSFKEALGINGTVGKTGIALNVSNVSTTGFSVSKDKTGNGNFDKDGFHQQALNSHIKQMLSDKLSIQADFQLSQNKFDLDAGAFTDDKDFTGKKMFLFGSLTTRYTLPKGSIGLILSENDVEYKFNNPDNGTYFSRQDNTGNITYTEAILNQKLSDHIDLTGGVNYRYTKTDQSYESLSAFGPYNSYLKAKDANNDILSSFASTFFSSGSFHFELGGRYNRHSDYGNNFTYTINPSYVIANRYKLFVNLSSAFKMPSLYQLASEYKNPNGLNPETTTSYEAGTDLDLIPHKVNLNISAFIRNTEDLIYFYTDPKTFASQYRNGNKQHDKGFEVELNTNPSKKFSFNAWYANVVGRAEDINGVETNYLLRRPKNTFGAYGEYKINNAVSMSLTYKYTGNRLDPYGYPTVNINQHAYSLMDGYIQVRPVNHLMLFLDIKNLFNERYTEWEGYNTRERNFNLGFKYDIR
jgi:vitamin B12 transporter